MTPPTRRPGPPQRVVLYVRVSALMDRGGDTFHSPDVQTAAMRRLTHGLREVDVVVDLDRTGRHFNREGIAKIRAMAEARRIDALAVYDVSRLGRNVRESLTFLAELADLGVTILSACEQVDTSTPAGRLMLTNMLAIAEYRSDEIGRSWSATIARRAAQGKHHGRPIGYLREGGRLVPDPVLGPAVTQAWRDYADGLPVSQVCDRLAAARGTAMAISNMKTIFKRPVYLGHATSGGRIVAQDAHEPLVDEKTWTLVQQRLLRDRVTPSRSLEVTWSLVGITFCPCGSRLQRFPSKRNGGEQRLLCGLATSRGMRGGDCPGVGTPLLPAVEAEVLRQVEQYIRRLRSDHTTRAARRRRQTSAASDSRTLTRRLTTVQEGIARLAKMNALGELQDAEFQSAAADLRTERDHLQLRLAELGDVEARPAPEAFASAAEALLKLWPDMLVAERNAALRDLIEKIEVRRAAFWREPEADRVTITWR